MLAEMTRYKVTVQKLKRSRPQDDDAIFIHEGDCFFGYGYKTQRPGKYFDLWFTNPKEEDLDNFVTFGRVLVIDGNQRSATFYTKLGIYVVEDLWQGVSDRASVASSACASTASGWTPGKPRASFLEAKRQAGMSVVLPDGSRLSRAGWKTRRSGKGVPSRKIPTGRA